MRLYVFSVYDAKAEGFMTPFFFKSKGEATRAFVDTVAGRDSAISRHPGDFTLFYIGSFEDSNASFEAETAPVPLKTGLEARAELVEIASTLPLFEESA